MTEAPLSILLLFPRQLLRAVDTASWRTGMNWACCVLFSIPVIVSSQVRGFESDYRRQAEGHRRAIADLVPFTRTTEGVQNLKSKIRTLIEQGADINYDRGKPLFGAVYHDKSGMAVEELISLGAQPNLYNPLIGSPLFFSVESGVKGYKLLKSQRYSSKRAPTQTLNLDPMTLDYVVSSLPILGIPTRHL